MCQAPCALAANTLLNFSASWPAFGINKPSDKIPAACTTVPTPIGLATGTPPSPVAPRPGPLSIACIAPKFASKYLSISAEPLKALLCWSASSCRALMSSVAFVLTCCRTAVLAPPSTLSFIFLMRSATEDSLKRKARSSVSDTRALNTAETSQAAITFCKAFFASSNCSMACSAPPAACNLLTMASMELTCSAPSLSAAGR
mmetsp:Transcript_27468/g.63498  ORF Transcript_27468/g.63498 Transcript_27468/m.63498 type:complete len:202 (-) Transcript_27468:74-679(-)